MVQLVPGRRGLGRFSRRFGVLTAVAALLCAALQAQQRKYDGVAMQAVERGTLDQAGTPPFHLKARFEPAKRPDNGKADDALKEPPGPPRVGTVEFWWLSPRVWRRELRAPGFHQTMIVNQDRQWQHTEGDYFPEWLRELANALVHPVPLSHDGLAESLRLADVRRRVYWDHYSNHEWLEINFQWYVPPGSPDAQPDGDARTGVPGYLAMYSNTGFVGSSGLSYSAGEGWSGRYTNLKKFHGLHVARTVESGTPAVVATVDTLEDLHIDAPEAFFSVTAANNDTHPVQTIVVRETELRQHWQRDRRDMPKAGTPSAIYEAHAELALDREGNVREVLQITAPPKTRADAQARLRDLHFTPITRNGEPVQAIGRFTLRFQVPLLTSASSETPQP